MHMEAAMDLLPRIIPAAVVLMLLVPPLRAGAKVRYYVEARSGSSGTTSFLPPEAESGALTYRVKRE